MLRASNEETSEISRKYESRPSSRTQAEVNHDGVRLRFNQLEEIEHRHVDSIFLNAENPETGNYRLL